MRRPRERLGLELVGVGQLLFEVLELLLFFCLFDLPLERVEVDPRVPGELPVLLQNLVVILLDEARLLFGGNFEIVFLFLLVGGGYD